MIFLVTSILKILKFVIRHIFMFSGTALNIRTHIAVQVS